jgi:hypothetical protein
MQATKNGAALRLFRFPFGKLRLFLFVPAPVPAAAAAIAGLLQAFAERILSALDDHRFCVDEHIREFFSRVVIDALHGRARDTHLRGALLLRKTHQVDQSNGFIFVHAHHNVGIGSATRDRAKGCVPRQAANPAAFSRPWHIVLPRSSALAVRGRNRPPAKTLKTVYYAAIVASIDLAHSGLARKNLTNCLLLSVLSLLMVLLFCIYQYPFKNPPERRAYSMFDLLYQLLWLSW